MAATLMRFVLSIHRQTLTRSLCSSCGNVLLIKPQRIAQFQHLSPVSKILPVNRCSTAVQTAEDKQELDELYRQVIVEVKGHDKAVMKSYSQFVSMAASELGINLVRMFEPPKVITRYSILKSVHIYKKHFVQYEARTHYNVYELKHLTGSTADTFLEYIQRNLPEGMAMKVTRHRLEKIPDHLKPPGQKTPSSEAQKSLEAS